MHSDSYSVRSQGVIDFVSRRIIAGQLGPGEQVSEKVLARDLGCSIVPVREALTHLVGCGVLHKVPHRGTYARQLTPAETTALADFRLVLYTFAVGRAAVDPEPAGLADLETTLATFEDHIRSGVDQRVAAATDVAWFEFMSAAVNNMLQVNEAVVRTARLEAQAATYHHQDLLFLLSTRHLWGMLPREMLLRHLKETYVDCPLSGFLPAVKDRDSARAQRLHLEQYQGAFRKVMTCFAAVGIEIPPLQENDIAAVNVEFHSESTE